MTNAKRTAVIFCFLLIISLLTACGGYVDKETRSFMQPSLQKQDTTSDTGFVQRDTIAKVDDGRLPPVNTTNSTK